MLLALVMGIVLILAACAEDEEPAADGGGDGGGAQGGVVTIEGGDEFNGVFVPKSTDNPVFTEANEGAQQAADAGATVVSWDSPIPGGIDAGESLFVAQVDFDETGQVMADMALELMPDGGEFAILSATPDAANQNAWIAAMEEVLQGPDYADLELVDTVYGNDDPNDSYNQALALVDQHPDLKLIMAPTTVGIAAAAQAMQDEDLCGEVLVSGLGLPSEMKEYTLNGCAQKFALWSFKDLGYLAFYATYGIATGQIAAEEGQQFEAGRMGEYTIETDPTRDNGLRIVMGPFAEYDESNVEEG